jgi:hypothetical protein
MQGHSVAGRFRSIENPNDLTRTRTRDLPACTIVPQPTTLPRALKVNDILKYVDRNHLIK